MKIAFVLPIYRVPTEYLTQAIESILCQTYPDLEIILVDDGSPDDCGALCDRYASQDPRITVIHKQNGGLSDARNAGLRAVTAEWVTFLDGDDWVDSDFVQKFVSYFCSQKEASEIYYFNGYRNYPHQELVGKPHFETGTVFASYKDRENLQAKCFHRQTASSCRHHSVTISAAWAKIYRTDFLRKNGLLFPLVPYAEDSLFYLDSIEAATRIEYIAEPVYHYRFTEGSIVNCFRPNAEAEQKIYLDHLFGFCDRSGKSDAFRQQVYLRVMLSMLLLIKQKFFHQDNPAPYRERKRACKRLFRTEPYRSVFRCVPFFSLSWAAKLKYILLWLNRYELIDLLRKLRLKRRLRSSKNISPR